MAKGHDSAGRRGGAHREPGTMERGTQDGRRAAAAEGEAIDAVSRDTQMPAHELEEWRRVFLESGTQGLKKRIDPEDRELRRVQAKLGEVMMRLELAEDLIEKKGDAAELRKHGR